MLFNGTQSVNDKENAANAGSPAQGDPAFADYTITVELPSQFLQAVCLVGSIKRIPKNLFKY